MPVVGGHKVTRWELKQVVHGVQTDLGSRYMYSTYYKPMGDLSYISSEQGGGLIIHHGLIMRITIYKHPIPIH